MSSVGRMNQSGEFYRSFAIKINLFFEWKVKKKVYFSSFDPNDTTFSVERVEHKYLSDIFSCDSSTRN